MKRLISAVATVAIAGAALYWFASPKHPEMVPVPAGPAVLGYVYYTGLYGPRAYDVEGFLIDRFEVTNAAYAEFVEATGYAQPAFYDDAEFNAPDQPVTGVLHNDAIAYCDWAGKRLPTEIEWEKAARGVDGLIYPWGDEFDETYAHLSGVTPVGVGGFETDVSPYGVRGMAGNVSEWVSDIRVARAGVCRDNNAGFDGNITPEMRELLADLTAANGGVLPELCVAPDLSDMDIPGEDCAYIKGNSWAGRDHMTVASNRMWDYTNTYAEFVGFRCAISSK